MTLTLDDYQELMRKLNRLERRRAEAKGAHDQVMKKLKQDFGVTSLKQAKRKLEEMIDQQLAIHRKYAKAKSAFEKKHAKVLKEI